MENSSWVQQRADRIHGRDKTPASCNLPQQDRRAIWKNTVHCKEDAEKYFQQFHPEFGKELSAALANYYDRMIKGEIEVDPKLLDLSSLPQGHPLKKASEELQKSVPTKWDPTEEIEQHILEAKMNLAAKRLEKLLLEEDEATAAAAKPKAKKSQ